MPILDASGGEGAGMVIHQTPHVARVKNQGSAGNGGNKVTDGASIGGDVWDSSISGLEVLVEIVVDRDRGSGTSDNLVVAHEDEEERTPSQNHLQIPRRLHQIWVRSISNAPQHVCPVSLTFSLTRLLSPHPSFLSPLLHTSPHITSPHHSKPCHTQSDLNSTDFLHLQISRSGTSSVHPLPNFVKREAERMRISHQSPPPLNSSDRRRHRWEYYLWGDELWDLYAEDKFVRAYATSSYSDKTIAFAADYFRLVLLRYLCQRQMQSSIVLYSN